MQSSGKDGYKVSGYLKYFVVLGIVIFFIEVSTNATLSIFIHFLGIFIDFRDEHP